MLEVNFRVHYFPLEVLRVSAVVQSILVSLHAMNLQRCVKGETQNGCSMSTIMLYVGHVILNNTHTHIHIDEVALVFLHQ